jgi:hypothetical protein
MSQCSVILRAFFSRIAALRFARYFPGQATEIPSGIKAGRGREQKIAVLRTKAAAQGCVANTPGSDARQKIWEL